MPETGNLWGTALSAPKASDQSTANATSTKIASVGTLNAPKSPKPRKKSNIQRANVGNAPQATNDTDDDGEVETLGERVLMSGIRLIVLKGNIVDIDAECYVNPTSSSVYFGGQVGNALQNAGGDDLRKATQPFSGNTIPEDGGTHLFLAFFVRTDWLLKAHPALRLC